MEARVLFTPEHTPLSENTIRQKLSVFPYTDAVDRVINKSKELDKDGKVFIECATLILSNFGMTRSGRFKREANKKEILQDIWREIGDSLVAIHNSIFGSGLSRDRFLLELEQAQLEKLLAEIWMLAKKLLPYTMGKYSYGLVGANKILFAVLPEVVLPIDNVQWLHVFQTVDLGDVLNRMVFEINRWEKATGTKLNELDASRRLTTLPSVYNVMAMEARPKDIKEEV